jgi:hypothetical protein
MFSFIYRFFQVLTNATFFKNTFVKLTQTSKGLPYHRLTLIEKMFWSIFPNVKSINFNIINETTLKLLDFRKTYFSSLSYKISSFYSFNYSLPLKLLTKYVDFFSERSANFFNLKKIFFTKSDYMTVYIFLFFFKRNFYKYFSLLFFKEKHDFNLIKINFIFFRYFYRADIEKPSLSLFNLWKSTDWYDYNFDKNLYQTKLLPNYKNVWLESIKEEWLKKHSYFYGFYNSVITKLATDGIILVNKSGHTYLKSLVLNYYNIVKLTVNNDFINKIKKLLPVRFSERSTNKFIDLLKVENYSIFFLRKNKIFNKGRYSRNRQTYRTGFYWSLWVNIFVIYGLHFAFYRFTFNFGYLWIPFIFFFGSFLFARILKYNFHNYNYIISEIVSLISWFSILLDSFFSLLLKLLDLLKCIFLDLTFLFSNSKLNRSTINVRSMDYRETKLFEFITFFKKYSIYMDFYFDKFFQRLFLETSSEKVNSFEMGDTDSRKTLLTFLFYKYIIKD